MPHPHPPDQHPGHNTSVNPARSSGPTLFVGGCAVQQLWLFWVAPIAGALLAGVVFRALFEPDVRSRRYGTVVDIVGAAAP
jgi:Major intrinsic protein